ncbi:MAG: cytochrome P450 [Solirubrobacteraceae bacterium]|nr:cytochrome P450 [Solirubrobacteraceae bacterium]
MSSPSQVAPGALPTELSPLPPNRRMRPREVARFLRYLPTKDMLKAFAVLPGDSGLAWIGYGAGPPVAFIRDPEHARQVLVTNQDNYVKGNDYQILAVLLGKGLLTNFDLEHWQRQRKLVQPLFAKRHLAPMATSMIGGADTWLDGIAPDAAAGRTIDVNSAMMALTLDVVCRALFGTRIDGPTTKTVGKSMDTLLRAAQANFKLAGVYDVMEVAPKVTFAGLLRLRRVHWNRAMKAKAEMDRIVYGLIDHRVAHPDADAQDLLSLLLNARDEDDGSEMDREQVRDEVMTFLGAGHETTANALTWLWLALSRNPEARRRMEQEVDEVLGGRMPVYEDAERLPWTNACLHEAMRLFPPVPAFTRVAAGSDDIDGLRIERGADVVIAPYLLHRNPRFWSNPEGFDPERFMPGGEATRPGRPRLAFMPFGGGRRICVGQGFAQLEGVLMAAMIAQRIRFDLVPGTQVRHDVAITLRPRDGMPMTVRRRDDAPPLVR